mmetsp:Transcript_25121/g.63171  ORF Transcript_25121/g.63171 Transcript_25121/m.63171 type:complete len:207 (+) Transcript_25121:4564-5184(+)
MPNRWPPARCAAATYQRGVQVLTPCNSATAPREADCVKHVEEEGEVDGGAVQCCDVVNKRQNARGDELEAKTVGEEGDVDAQSRPIQDVLQGVRGVLQDVQDALVRPEIQQEGEDDEPHEGPQPRLSENGEAVPMRRKDVLATRSVETGEREYVPEEVQWHGQANVSCKKLRRHLTSEFAGRQVQTQVRQQHHRKGTAVVSMLPGG